MAYKVFQNGYPLPASELNNYLMNQTVMVFATASARAADLTSPTEGMVTYREDANVLEVYDGSAWTDINDNTGAIPKSLIDAAGDLIVGSAADTPARLAVGGAGALLKSDGTSPAWLSAGTSGYVLTSSGTDVSWQPGASGTTTLEVFTSSTTWTVPTGVTRFAAYVVGGGGGGASGSIKVTNTSSESGGGGGTGGATFFDPIRCTPGEVFTITVGAGGSGGAAVSSVSTATLGLVGTNGSGSSIQDSTGNFITIAGGGLTPTTYNNGGSGANEPSTTVYRFTTAFPGRGGGSSNGTAPSPKDLRLLTNTSALGSNGAAGVAGTTLGSATVSTNAGVQGSGGGQGQHVANSTTLGTMNGIGQYGSGSGGAAAASNSNITTTAGSGGSAGVNTAGGGGGGGAAVKVGTTSTAVTSGAGGNGGSGFVAIIY